MHSYFQIHNRSIPQYETATIIYQVLQGLQYMHEQNIVHRDVKLENILMTSFDPANRVVISDFGFARRIPEAKSRTGSIRSARMKTWVQSRSVRQCAP